MKSKLLSFILLFSTPLFAQIDCTSGGTGTITGFPQSFNETRGVDVTVVSANNVMITGMSLHGFYVGGDGMAFVGARIYSSSSNALLFSHDTTVYNINNGTINIPASCLLNSGTSYRVCFYCSGTNSDNSGFMWQPNSFPYTETRNLLQINSAWESASDAFPVNTNIFVPIVSLQYDSTFTTEITENDLSSAINLFPNPFNSQLTVTDNSIGQTTDETTITLFDVASRKVFEQVFTNSTSINTETLNQGIYFYEVRNKNGVIKKGKTVKE